MGSYRDMTPEQKTAQNARTAAWAARNKDRVREIQRQSKARSYNVNQHRLRRYGITSETFDRMLAEQGGVCAVCGTTEHGARGWHLDHCHTTGLPRGVLCVRCNGGLGLFKDNPVVLHSAIEYLKKAAFAALM